MFWTLMANALALPAWALVPLGVNLIRHARVAPSSGRRLRMLVTGLALMTPALVCSFLFVWYGLAAGTRGGMARHRPWP